MAGTDRSMAQDQFNELRTRPTVSVVLAAYNGENTIAEAVASVLAQSLCDIELIVVDDGSVDGTRAVLRETRDERLRVFSQRQFGPAASRNRGLEYSIGDYIAFIDADDVWLPDKLKLQVSHLERVSDAAVSYCWTDYIESDGRFTGADSRPRFEGNVHEQIVARNFIDCGSNILVRREALLQVGGFDESLPVAEDWDLNIRLSEQNTFVCTPYPLVLYRQSAASLSTRVHLMEEMILFVIEETFRRNPALPTSLKKKSIGSFYQYLTGKATRGVPTRRKGLLAVRYFSKSISNDPANLVDTLKRPWLVKAVGKALLAIALPRAVTRRLSAMDPLSRGSIHPYFARNR